ncbi:iron-containing alcohol dehydrogenase [Paraburkholderia sp. Ac-20336]|uniref:iron-containing alcohol dehydrogenase n=1 Tax=Paraburkholderia sp. Ac-20336 TaxID=2703886 RepID=UPI00197F28B3|nr:iron-containing alcohol dehydrogenase [Paraburkholderia sp. Ac-20336]MBN3801920.1 iron-containing alcohol dehydrogenase [Paraburkholderia sp. Ac-20336]
MQEIFGVMRTPHSILFGVGQRHVIGEVVGAVGRRALVCTDQRFAASREMNEIMASLRQRGVDTQVFDGTQAELPVQGVYDCVDQFRAFAPQVIIGLGGGSCMDLAKLVSLALSHGTPLDQYYGEFKVPGPILPVIAVATTAGTGSEVTPVAVLADQARDLKVGISSPYLIPHTSICDPELTVTCPPGLTALSGADALTHAIEAYTAIRHPFEPELALKRVFVGKNHFSDHHALSAIQAIAGHLRKAVDNGTDMHARAMLMAGAVSAGLAFGVAGTAAAHAIQYPVGALTHTAHGLGVAALLPYVMAYNAPVCQQELADIAVAMGAERGGTDVAARAVSMTRDLCASVGIPHTLADLGLAEDRLGWVAEQSMLSARLINNNPRPLQVDDVREIVDCAFYGRA